MIEAIIPKNEEHWLTLRTKDVTSTEVPALFGCSPWCTEFELWHRKADVYTVDFKANERTKWGQRLEASIGNGIAEDEGWTIAPMPEYVRDTELRLGASFDFSIQDGRGFLETKNVDSLQFKNEWSENDDKTVEAPPHIELQVQQQLMLTGRKYAAIGVLVGGNRVVLIQREPDIAIQDAIKNKVAAFWKSIEEKKPPAPVFERDAAIISKIYGYAEPGKVIEADSEAMQEEMYNLAMDYKEAGDLQKAAEKKKKEAKARMLMKIGTAEKFLGGQFNISAKIVGPASFHVDREGYRGFRVTWPKQKEDKK